MLRIWYVYVTYIIRIWYVIEKGKTREVKKFELRIMNYDF